MATMSTRWDDMSWISIGARLRYTSFTLSEWKNQDQSDKRTLRPGMLGTVVEFIGGFPAHRCPDHKEYPDCICGEEDAIVSACEKAAVVAWEAEGGLFRRCIHRDGEGWEHG